MSGMEKLSLLPTYEYRYANVWYSLKMNLNHKMYQFCQHYKKNCRGTVRICATWCQSACRETLCPRAIKMFNCFNQWDRKVRRSRKLANEQCQYHSWNSDFIEYSSGRMGYKNKSYVWHSSVSSVHFVITPRINHWTEKTKLLKQTHTQIVFRTKKPTRFEWDIKSEPFINQRKNLITITWCITTMWPT